MNDTVRITPTIRTLRMGMVGMGMIFDETYRPFFESVHGRGLFDPTFGICAIVLAATASRTGARAEAYRGAAAGKVTHFESFAEPGSVDQMLKSGVDAVCIATPDNRHFAAAHAVLAAGKHVLIEKPSVLSLAELDALDRLAKQKGVLAKVVYHKLLDPDHKKLRTLVVDGELHHVNNGYCSLLEPKTISGTQFGEWIAGRNPGTYVAVHYIKLIDFIFGGKLRSVQCTGQRGIVGPADGPTWDSTQLRLVYQYPDKREAAFDIHTSWVTPDNFPGYVEQEVQFRFDNGVWNSHGRKRGVECTIEARTPVDRKVTMNNHYNGTFIEPWGKRSQRGYGIEAIERFAREVAEVEFGGARPNRRQRLMEAQALEYNDLSADRQTVAAVQAMEAILARHAAGTPDCVVHVNDPAGGLVLYAPGSSEPEVLYAGKVQFYEPNSMQQRRVVEHPGEKLSNELRERLAVVEPAALRTFTPSLAVLATSAGCYHYTPEGRRLADFTSGVLVANLGHNPTRWWQRVLHYMSLDHLATQPYCYAAPLTAYNAVTPIEVQAAERLVASMQSQAGGARCQQVLWGASGSEAIQKAIWAALDRRAGQDMILATRRGFHGKKGLAGAVTGSEQDEERDSRVRFISFPTAECENVARRREPLDLTPYRQELDKLWAELGTRVCCLVTEPYLGGGGSYHPQAEFMQLLEQFCRQHDIVFILDEIQANFGRTGSLYAFTHYGVEPDIVVLGKGLGNGIPVDAAVGRADLFANMHYGEGSDTWSAHPLGCAAVLATLDEFETTDVLTHAQELAAVIETGLLKLSELDLVAHVRGEGLVWGVECQGVGSQPADEVANACVEACYLGQTDGLAIHLLGPLAGKVIRVSPPLVMPLDEAREYLAAMYEIFAAVQSRLGEAASG